METHLRKLCLLFALWNIAAEAKDCKLPLPALSFFPPLVLTPNGTLKSTESSNDNQFVRMKSEEIVILSCAPNYFKSIESTFVEAICKEDTILVINGEEKNFLKELSCEVRAIEEVLQPVTGCDPKYASVKFGYTNPITIKSHILGEACYDEELGKTIFVHTKTKSDFVNTEINDISLSLQDANYFKKKHPLSRFKLDFLIASRFDDLNERMTENLGSTNIAELLLQKHYLGMNMLMNNQFYNVLKLGWNYVMAAGKDVVANLAVLENDILKMKSEKSLDIYIGSNGVAKVLGKNGDVELYLKDNRFPIPKNFWMGVRSGNKFVGFAVINSPSPSARMDLFFNSKCDEITWLKKLLETKLAEDRKVVCCEYQNFKNNIPEMPELTGRFELFV